MSFQLHGFSRWKPYQKSKVSNRVINVLDLPLKRFLIREIGFNRIAFVCMDRLANVIGFYGVVALDF